MTTRSSTIVNPNVLLERIHQSPVYTAAQYDCLTIGDDCPDKAISSRNARGELPSQSVGGEASSASPQIVFPPKFGKFMNNVLSGLSIVWVSLERSCVVPSEWGRR